MHFLNGTDAVSYVDRPTPFHWIEWQGVKIVQ